MNIPFFKKIFLAALSMALTSQVFAGKIKSDPVNILVTTGVPAGASNLAKLAASMPRGSWAPLPTNNINETLLATGADSNSLGYTDDITYDPVTEKFFYYGGDHAAPALFAVFDSKSNTWSKLPKASWMPALTDYNNGMTHAYDHSAIDPDHRYFYHRRMGGFDVHRYNIDTQIWDASPVPIRPSTAPFGAYANCCDALEYFKELGGLVWIAGDGLPGQNNGHAYLFNTSTQQWTVLASNLDLSGTWTGAEYNPVQKTLIFYSAQTNMFYKLNSSGQVSAISKTSFLTYNGSSYAMVLTSDPTSGKYIALSAGDRTLYSYDASNNTNTWQPLASASKPDLSSKPVVATPVSNLGVILFTACKVNGGCQVYLYKY